jgi:hypothetical protein
MALVDAPGTIDLKNEEGEVVIQISFKFDDSVPEDAQANFVYGIGQLVAKNIGLSE